MCGNIASSCVSRSNVWRASTGWLLVAGRNREAVGGRLVGDDLLLHRCRIGELKPDATAIGGGFAVGRVVHLKHELRAGGNQLGVALGTHQRTAPGGRGGEPFANASRLRFLRPSPGGASADDDVMHHAAIAGPALGGLRSTCPP